MGFTKTIGGKRGGSAGVGTRGRGGVEEVDSRCAEVCVRGTKPAARMLEDTTHRASKAPTECLANWAEDREGALCERARFSDFAESGEDAGLGDGMGSEGSRGASSAGWERLCRVRMVRDDVNTKAVLGLEAALVDVLVVVVVTRELLQSPRLSLGGGVDLRLNVGVGTRAAPWRDAGR